MPDKDFFVDPLDLPDTPLLISDDEGYKWEAIPGGVRLTGYTGLLVELIVPSEYPAGSGNPVLELCGTFDGNKLIETVTIPDTVRVIGARTFAGCQNLHTLILPDSVETFAPDALLGCRDIRVFCTADSAAYRYIEQLPVCDGILAFTVPSANDYSTSESIPEPDFYPDSMDMDMDMGFGGMYADGCDCDAGWGGSGGYASMPAPPMPAPIPAPDMIILPSQERTEASHGKPRLSAKSRPVSPSRSSPCAPTRYPSLPFPPKRWSGASTPPSSCSCTPEASASWWMRP